VTKPFVYTANRDDTAPNARGMNLCAKRKMAAQQLKNRDARISMMLTKMGRERWNGDPDIQPPPLVKPVASGPLGKCPDDEQVPWHRRTKANR